MPSEMEFVNFKDFVDSLTETENPTSADKGVVSNSVDGPRSVPDPLKVYSPNNKTQVYITNRGSLFYEESNASLGSIYIKAVNGSFAVRGSSPSRTYNMSALAAALGVNLVTSPSGVTDCLEIKDAYCLVLDSGNNFAIKERTAVAQNDVVIIACIEGNVCAYNSQAFGYVVARRLRDNDTAIKGVQSVLGETTNSTNSHTFEAGITSGFWLAPKQKISVGDFVKIHVQSSSGVLKYRVYPKGTGTGKPSYNIDVSDDYEFVADTALTAGSNFIQMYIDGLEKDGQGDVVGGSITFSIDVTSGVVGDVKELFLLVKPNVPIIESLNNKNTRKCIQFYANGQSNIYVEESRANLGKVWIKSTSDQWAGRLGVNWNYSNATLATALGKTLETSPKGVTDCIPLGDGDNIVITESKALACKNRNSVLDSDVVVFACLDGKFRGFDSVIFGQVMSDQLAEIRGLIGDGSNPFYFMNTGWMAKQETFCELFNGVSLCDAFLFFTDPHFMKAQDWSGNTKKYVEIIRKWYDCTPTDFIVCGGDWLQNNDTQALALSKLGFIDGIMNHTFDRYYPILGNHDTNYQGVVSADDSSRGDLLQGTLNSIWFNRVGGKSYYDFKARATKFYVFDSGIDWTVGVVSEYEWEQVDWFANKLLAGSDEHIGLMLHLISNNASEIQPVAFAQILLDIAYAFNSRTSITRHDITYDFTSATGYVEFMLGGHTHSDLSATFHDIPIVTTTRVLTPGTNPTFDLVLVDYTNNKLKMVRIGSGSDREFDLYSASL